MNDLTFGAALLACFVTLAAAAVTETASAPARHPATAAPHVAPVRLAAAPRADCLSVAQAPKSH